MSIGRPSVTIQVFKWNLNHVLVVSHLDQSGPGISEIAGIFHHGCVYYGIRITLRCRHSSHLDHSIVNIDTICHAQIITDGSRIRSGIY